MNLIALLYPQTHKEYDGILAVYSGILSRVVVSNSVLLI